MCSLLWTCRPIQRVKDEGTDPRKCDDGGGDGCGEMARACVTDRLQSGFPASSGSKGISGRSHDEGTVCPAPPHPQRCRKWQPCESQRFCDLRNRQPPLLLHSESVCLQNCLSGLLPAASRGLRSLYQQRSKHVISQLHIRCGVGGSRQRHQWPSIGPFPLHESYLYRVPTTA